MSGHNEARDNEENKEKHRIGGEKGKGKGKREK